MKTPLFSLVALVALFSLPLDFTTLISVLFATGLLAILTFDYRRTHRRIASPAFVAKSIETRERFRLAA